MTQSDETFEGIFATYHRPVVRFFVARGFSREDAQDLAQAVFLQVFRRLKDLQDPSLVGAWVFTTAGNVWRNELRRIQTKKRSAPPPSDDAPSYPSWGEPADAGDDDPTHELIAAERGKLLAEDAAAEVKRAWNRFRANLAKGNGSPGLEAEIDRCYAELLDLTRSSPSSRPKSPESPGSIERVFARLRTLQQREAAGFRQQFESNLKMSPDAGARIIARAGALREKLEDLVASDLAARRTDAT